MKKKVMPIILVLAIAFGVIAFKPSLAWLSSSFNKSQKVDIGALSYTFDGTVSLNASYTDGSLNTYATPGENLLYVGAEPGALAVNNFSTITTNLRIRIDYSYYDSVAHNLTVAYGEKPELTDDFDVVFNTTTGTFEYNTLTKYWDYKDTDAPVGSPYNIPTYAESTIVVTTAGETTTGETTTGETTTGETTTATVVDNMIYLIDSLGYSSLIGNNSSYKNEPVSVKLTVQVKQADYVEWSTIATIIAS